MAPLEPSAVATAEPPFPSRSSGAAAPSSETHPRTRHSLSISSHAAQTHLSTSVTSLRSAAVASTRTTGTAGIHALTARLGLGGVARRTLGITLLLVTVFLWTLSNFLASYIFSNHTYDKPFFVVYINTSVFAVSLVPMLARFVQLEGVEGVRREARGLLVWRGGSSSSQAEARDAGSKERGAGGRIPDEEHHGLLARSESEDDLLEEGEGGSSSETFEVDDSLEGHGGGVGEKLSLRETAVLSLEFCMLWFCANYFASACLEYTSVGSVTILTSTSSVWTLVFCAVMGVDTFTLRKLVGVLASLAGVVLISTVDLSGASDEDRGSFPHKSQTSIAIGDGMAFFSAIVYGLYVTVMKRRVGDEDRVNMQLFFGLVGLFNLLLLWPGFFVLHWTQIEPFEWPPTGKIWGIILVSRLFLVIIWSTC